MAAHDSRFSGNADLVGTAGQYGQYMGLKFAPSYKPIAVSEKDLGVTAQAAKRERLPTLAMRNTPLATRKRNVEVVAQVVHDGIAKIKSWQELRDDFRDREIRFGAKPSADFGYNRLNILSTYPTQCMNKFNLIAITASPFTVLVAFHHFAVQLMHCNVYCCGSRNITLV